jgi:hypothetical protein
VTFEVPHFSLWAFAVRTPAAAVPPAAAAPAAPGTSTTQGGQVPPAQVVPAPAKTGTGLPAMTQAASMPWAPIVLTVVALSVLGGFGIRRRG